MDATPLDRRKFYFDFKWFLIFAIVAFLIIFEAFIRLSPPTIGP